MKNIQASLSHLIILVFCLVAVALASYSDDLSSSSNLYATRNSGEEKAHNPVRI